MCVAFPRGSLCGAILRPGGPLAMSADIFDGHNGERRVLLASSGQRPGTLLTSYQAQDRPPPSPLPRSVVPW